MKLKPKRQANRGSLTRHYTIALAAAALMTVTAECPAATLYVSGPSTNSSPLRFRAITAGQWNSLGLQSNGTAVAWGYNIDFGHTGLPSGLTGVTALASGDNHSLALKSDGTVVAWGDDSYGQTNVPQGLNGVVAIAAQAGHNLALRTGGYLAAWGDNESGESYVPGDLFGGALAIAAGESHNLVIRSDGTVEAWGDNTYGQCNVPAGLSNVVAIAAGVRHSLALKSDGTVVAWGSSIYDETNVPSGLSGVIAISSYWANCAALKADGTVVTWGANHSVPQGLGNVVAIATGGQHDLALKADGTVIAWGDNRFGQASVPGTVTTDHNIQDTIAIANDGDTIMVAPGQYNLTNQIAITKAILLKGTMGAGQTFLNIGVADWGLWVSNSAAVVDGFTLQALSDPISQAGVLLVGGTVQNCTFTNFWTARQGASVSMAGGILSNSIVTYQRWNSGGGSGVSASSGALVSGCQILGDRGGHGGDGDGVGIYLVGSQLRNTYISGLGGATQESSGQALYALSSTIVGCTITRNANPGAGGGAYLNSCLMDRCIVTGNSSRGEDAGMGGGGIFETNSIVRNSLIVSNNADENAADPSVGGLGGGVYMQGGALVNCTVADNGAFSYFSSPPNPSPIGHGAGVYVESGGLTNCIIFSNYFYGDAAAGLDNEWFNAGPGIFDHCCTTPDPGGVGNIIQDPQFLDPTNSNFHLASTSPCLGTGIVQDWMSGAFDLDGNPRTANGKVDIGAYQSGSAPPPSLRIFATTNNTVIVAWPASASGYVLQQCPQMNGSSWTSAEVSPHVVGSENQVAVGPAVGIMCYRLRHP